MNSCRLMNEIQHISGYQSRCLRNQVRKLANLNYLLFEDRRTSRREPTRVIFCRVVESYYLIQMKI